MYIIYVNPMHDFSTLPIANSCLSHFYCSYVCHWQLCCWQHFSHLTFWLLMSEMLPVFVYPSRGYINFGQEFAMLYIRVISDHIKYIYSETASPGKSIWPSVCPSVCPTVTLSICMLQRKLFFKF